MSVKVALSVKKGSMDDVFSNVTPSFLGHSKLRDDMCEMVTDIYHSLGMESPSDRILSGIAQTTFTKSGTYNIFLVANKRTGNVYLIVNGDEIRGGQDVWHRLPNLKYKSKFFGLLGYHIVKSI